MRGPADPLTFFRALAEKPYDYDFYQALRRIECLFPDKPRLGRALRPVDEPVRFGQEASQSFAPAAISAFVAGEAGKPPRLEQRFFGMFGPNGPLPLHLTDYARERIIQGGDPTFARFVDIFHHRFLELFYRAWAQAQPTVSLDRPKEDRFAAYVGSLIGIGTPALRRRDEIGDFAKLFHVGLLVRQVRNRDGLAALLGGFFRVPVEVEQFVGHWMKLPTEDRTRIGFDAAGAQLGVGAVLGAAVWDRQHKFRIRIGPLGLAAYESFLPGGSAIARLVDLVRQYLCHELEWDVCIELEKEQVPQTRPGQFGRLGWTTWLGHYEKPAAAGDLLLDAERVLDRFRTVAGENTTGKG